MNPISDKTRAMFCAMSDWSGEDRVQLAGMLLHQYLHDGNVGSIEFIQPAPLNGCPLFLAAAHGPCAAELEKAIEQYRDAHPIVVDEGVPAEPPAPINRISQFLDGGE